jgi:cyclopropane fatty-acyl-phospholipid synthase-like methyltransferase
MTRLSFCVLVAAAVGIAAVSVAAQDKVVPVTAEIAAAMLKAAKVSATDSVVVLGSGDGTLAIAAAKDFGAAKVVGVESDAALVKQATAAAEKAGVGGKVTFIAGDPAAADLSGAKVVAVNLPASVNLKIAKKLELGLEPDSRVVAHGANMGDDWWPDETHTVGASKVFVWVVPYR